MSSTVPPRGRVGTIVMACIAYIATLTAAPGKVPADTKLYLYLDPGRLISDAPFSWDTRQFGGWVPHQAISYLWPSGPWFWVMERLAVPDWVAHRLWIGTILLAAGLGVRWAARLLGLDAGGAMAAALVYMLSPYVLPYISRTSVMLLPWAAVGWLVALVIVIARDGRWRDVGWFALVVATVGGVNVTATAMIAPAPLLWLLHATATREIAWRRAASTIAKVGGVSLAVSLWWIAMISTQGQYGAAVLGYSETLEAVSSTATGPEVLRGLGYWLFYVRDQAGPTTSASTPYLQSPALIGVGLALLLICVVGIVAVRWAYRRFAAATVLVGVLLAVGVHPIADASPLTSPLAEASRSTLALALRSSTRAVALSNFGLALGAGALVSAIGLTAVRWRVLAAPLVGLLAVLNLPAIYTGKLVDPLLLHDQEPPSAWFDAAAELDAGSLDHRVLQLPGTESQAFRWGYTVDPPLPGLTDKQLLTRDWLPLGSPAAMDLLYAFDDRFQNGTADPQAVAAVARLLGVDTVWLSGDADAQRFGSATADDAAAVLAGAPDIAASATFDDITLYSVANPQPIARAAADTVLLSGSGDGVVDAAAAGMIDGTEAIVYTAGLDADALQAAIADGASLIVTDSNRDRAHQWRGSQNVWGFTEEGGDLPGVLRTDEQDQRLPVFATDDANTQTVARLDGDITVRATSYGDPLSLLPQYRAAMAVDGDAATAWKVGIGGNPLGESLVVSTTDGMLWLQQAANAAAGARITQVRVSEGLSSSSAPMIVDLDDRSYSAPGQPVEVLAGQAITIEITAVAGVAENPQQGVGFAELGVGPFAEFVRVPTDGLAAAGPAIGVDAGAAGTPLTVVLTRLHDDDATSAVGDVEPALRRVLDLPTTTSFELTATVGPVGPIDIALGCRGDLLTIDGASVPLVIDDVVVDRFAAGLPATLRTCLGTDVRLAPGDRHVVGAGPTTRLATEMTVDRLILRNAAAVAHAANVTDAGSGEQAPVVSIERTRTQRTMTVGACPTGCWLILGEGASPGWQATADGVPLGEPTVVSGFAAWRLPANNGETRVVATWAPQQLVTTALLISAAALLACVVLVARDRRRGGAAFATPPRLTVAQLAPRVGWPAALLSSVVAIAITAVAVSAEAAMWLLPVVVVITALRRPALLRWIGLLMLLRLVVGMMRLATGITLVPGFAWPLQFEQWHRLTVTAIVVLFAGSLADRSAARSHDVAASGEQRPLPSPG